LKTIDREELKEKMDRGDDLLLLEVLGEASFNREHLPGAVRYEGRDQVEALAPNRSAEIVAYCSNFT
jgi:rhodanese-related sulfurtransferase